MSKGIGRASARTSEVCPRDSEFGRTAAAIDDADRTENYDQVERLELRLYRLRPSTLADWQWLARRLARALENGWHEGAVKPLLKLAGEQ